ncbi:hypothetical protein [Nocardia brasiliensis]|uniref:hypothetical protein n=1 Tax=Nocardia brasiliensis TaxID=37326 RepID=UPI003D8C719E
MPPPTTLPSDADTDTATPGTEVPDSVRDFTSGAATLPDPAELKVGQALQQGEGLSAGGYHLTFTDESKLVLTDAGGHVERVWEPDPPMNSASARVYLDSDGSLRIEDDRNTPGVVLTDPQLPEGSAPQTLRLTGDGTVHVVDGEGQRHEFDTGASVPIAPPTDGPAGATADTGQVIPPEHVLFPLFRPMGASEKLRQVIQLGEDAIDRLTDYAGIGLPGKITLTAPSVKPELLAQNLIYSNWHSTSEAYYADLAAKLGNLSEDLAKRDLEVRTIAGAIPEKIAASTKVIRDRVTTLNTTLALVGMAAGASASAEFEQTSIQAVFDTIHAVEDEVSRLWNELNNLANGIGETAPPNPDSAPDGTPAPDSDSSAGSDADTPAAPGGDTPAAPDTDASAAGADTPATPGADSGQAGGIPGLEDFAGDEGEESAGSGADADRLLQSLAQDLAGPAGNNATPGATGNPLAQALPMIAMAAMPVVAAVASAVGNVMTQQQRQQELDRERELRQAEAAPPPEPGPAAPPPPEPAPASPSPAPAQAAAPPPDSTPPPVPPAVSRNVDLPVAGTTYRVPEVVAGAVQNALNNPNGSDGVAAYNGTAGDPDSWRQVTGDVRTGDVVKYDHRSALVLVNDSGALHMIANGTVVPFDPNQPPEDGHGEYGGVPVFLRPYDPPSAAEDGGVTVPPVVAVPAVPPPPEVTTGRR